MKYFEPCGKTTCSGNFCYFGSSEPKCNWSENILHTETRIARLDFALLKGQPKLIVKSKKVYNLAQ